MKHSRYNQPEAPKCGRSQGIVSAGFNRLPWISDAASLEIGFDSMLLIGGALEFTPDAQKMESRIT